MVAMSFGASFALALWLGTIGGIAGLLVGYRLGMKEGKRQV